MNQSSSASSTHSRLKVFHGITGAAGQPASIVAALRKEGVDAVNYLVGSNKYGYEYDRMINPDGDLHSTLFDLLQNELQEFDVFHFYFRSLFYAKQSLSFPTGLDLAFLRLAGKKVIVNFRGSEARLHSKFKELSPFNYVDEDPDNLTTKFPEDTQKKYIEYVSAVASRVLVPDPELQSYVVGAEIVPRSIDLSKWMPCPTTNNDIPLIVHAPSRRVVKGTDRVMEVAQELKAEGLQFELKLIEGMTNEEARGWYRKADIIIDQLRIGWYGVLAVEGMALQKAVISYVRDDLRHHLGAKPPLINASPLTFKKALRDLITNPDLRERTARHGLEYCRNIHDSQIVARKLVSIYQSEDNPIDYERLFAFYASQHADYLGVLSSLAKVRKQNERQAKAMQSLIKDAERFQTIRRTFAPLFWARRKLKNLGGMLKGA